MPRFSKLLPLLLMFASTLVLSAQTLTVMHNFAGADGSGPTSSLAFGPGGNLYGTTTAGGASGLGTVFSVTPAGAFTLLHSFAGADGANPFGQLLYASDGNLYGMTNAGGSANGGVIYQITAAGQFNLVRSFTGFDGNNPYGGLIEGKNGNGYGFTTGGGLYGYGTVFRITPSGEYTVLHSFDATDGAYPGGTPLEVSPGFYAGTARRGGSGKDGTIFEAGDSGNFGYLNSTGPLDQSYSGFTAGPGGVFYATSLSGGDGYGSVFTVNSNLQMATFDAFTSTTGGFPVAGVILASDGSFYGTQAGSFLEEQSHGSIFSVTQTGTHEVLHAFTGADGEMPVGGLVQGGDGPGELVFYGTAYAGGARGDGVVYKLVVPVGAFSGWQSSG